MNKRTEIKDITPQKKETRKEELSEAELELVAGGLLPICTAPNTCHVSGREDDC